MPTSATIPLPILIRMGHDQSSEPGGVDPNAQLEAEKGDNGGAVANEMLTSWQTGKEHATVSEAASRPQPKYVPQDKQQTANAASSQAGSMKYSINGTTIFGAGVTYGKGTNKCNEFACDAVQSGTGYRPQVPKSGILGWLGFTRDPTAKEWATIAIPGWSAPMPLSTASPGDVIAMGHHDDDQGHVGIYVGNGMTASANFYEGGRITINNWGFRGPGQNGEHPGDAGPVVRKWVGLP